ncbi:MAG TPA: ribonuclease H-like domain-containing protein [Dehalococcoidia bacterium]
MAQHATLQLAAPTPGSSAGLPPIEAILRGTWHDTPDGPVFVRDEWYPLDHLHGAVPVDAPLTVHLDGLSHLLGGATPPDPSRLAFFDIETTGLSGGTGTYVVIAGLGSFEDNGYRLRQYFLAEMEHERAMLAMLSEDLARFDGIVTYNGRTFDLPFLQTRMTLARLRFPCDHLAHFDLLHPVRRLYKHRMRGCRLAEAERKLLRIERLDDISGALIPALYFDYVRAGRAAPLRAVFRHNADDVLSLGGILAKLARLLVRDDLDPDDAAAVARWWEAERQPERAVPLYRYALPWLEGGDDWAWAAGRHAALCKRLGARDEALPLWKELWRQGDRRAGLELAKHYEHHARDLDAAERLAAGLLAGCPEADAQALGVRVARIRSKRARADASRCPQRRDR